MKTLISILCLIKYIDIENLPLSYTHSISYLEL